MIEANYIILRIHGGCIIYYRKQRRKKREPDVKTLPASAKLSDHFKHIRASIEKNFLLSRTSVSLFLSSSLLLSGAAHFSLIKPRLGDFLFYGLP